MFANLEITGDAQIPRVEMVAVVGVPAKVADAICNGVGVSIGVETDEFRERTARLKSDDAAQLEMTNEAILGSRGSEVGDETVANVLVGVGALKRAVVKILRRADESGEGAIVESVREGVVGVQAEILAESFDHLKSES